MTTHLFLMFKIIDSGPDEIFCQMPLMRLVPVHESATVGTGSIISGSGESVQMYPCPLFQNSERSGEDNFILDLGLPTKKEPTDWQLAGVALLCQEPKDR